MSAYSALQRRLATGWNTWNSRSVLSHVLLPAGFALNLGLKDYWQPAYLREALVGNERKTGEKIFPGPRTYDGAYTALRLEWQGIQLDVQSATVGDDLTLLVTPTHAPDKHAVLIVESAILWNRPGSLHHAADALRACLPEQDVLVYATRASVDEPFVPAQTPYLAFPLDAPVGISTGRPRSLEEITSILADARARCLAPRERFAAAPEDVAPIRPGLLEPSDAKQPPARGYQETYDATFRCLTWNTIYDPAHNRVISPVSRNWNNHFGGFVIFCWDTFFASYLAAQDQKAIAYANAVEMIRERTDEGFVPCWSCGTGAKTLDRSNPPVGSFAVREIYRRWREPWLLEAVFDDLLAWNRWWPARRDVGGFLRLGSHPYTPLVGHWEESNGAGALQGSLFEAALDNSPMYDEVAFDASTRTMEFADVGLHSLYLLDCGALADIAGVLGRREAVAELHARAAYYRERLNLLWDDRTGIYRNLHTDTGQFSPHLSPTNFYPLFSGAVSPLRAVRMVREHLYNPAEFWGEWVVPSIARNDPAFADQRYWRGKIWPPMNFLLYLGLRYSGCRQAASDLAEKSRHLLLREWREHGHVHENYSGDTGWGCDRDDSDRYYHWGGLLGIMSLIEAGFVPGPEQPL